MSKVVVKSHRFFNLHQFKNISACIILLMITKTPLFSQSQTVSTSISLTRFDFFHSFECEYQPSKFAFGAGIGYGINRTIFQQRFYPRLSISSSYYVLKKERFQLGPQLNYAFSIIQLTPLSKLNQWNEFNAGIQWAFGGKWKIGQTFLIGYVSESHFSTIKNKRVSAGTLNYFTSISLKYEI